MFNAIERGGATPRMEHESAPRFFLREGAAAKRERKKEDVEMLGLEESKSACVKASAFAGLLFSAGCSIIMASRVPIARPPERLQAGVERKFVDRNYGYPIAYGPSSDGLHTEQIQFINGTPIGWKVARFCTHSTLDACTFFIYELIGTPIEIMHSDYPTYVYFVVYDQEGKIVRAVNADSAEGKEFAALYWTLPRDPDLKVNMNAELRQRIDHGLTNSVEWVSAGVMEGFSMPSNRTTTVKMASSPFDVLKQQKQDGKISEEEYNKQILKLMEEKK